VSVTSIISIISVDAICVRSVFMCVDVISVVIDVDIISVVCVVSSRGCLDRLSEKKEDD
jgi:hypothetical protein